MLDNIDNDTLVKGLIILLLLVNTALLIYVVSKQKKSSEGWSSGMGWNENSKNIANPSAQYIKPPAPIEPDYGQKTYAGCACMGYGVKSNKTMKSNDDSSLYADSIYQHY